MIPAVRNNGVPLQWSADITERAHIDLVKDPATNTNNQGHEAQITRHLDRQEKCRNFDLATAMAAAGIDFGDSPAARPALIASDPALREDDPPLLLNTTSKLLATVDPVSNLGGPNRHNANYFLESALLVEGRFPNAPTPFRTFTSPDDSTAFHLNRDYEGPRLSVDAAAEKFHLPDLRPALAAYLERTRVGTKNLARTQIVIGGKRPTLNSDDLPFEKIEYWKTVRIQTRSFHDRTKLLSSETINASPPDGEWKCG